MRRKRGWIFLWVCVVSCGGKQAGRDSANWDHSNFERGQRADARIRVCAGDILHASRLGDSVGPTSVSLGDAYAPLIDCILAAKNCDEVEQCPRPDRLDFSAFPVCDEASPTANHCEGNVAKLCAPAGDQVWHEFSFDCNAIDGGTCHHGTRNGISWVECVFESELCAEAGSRCEGERAIVCEQDPDTGLVRVGDFDCSQVFSSTCATPRGSDTLTCEGKLLREVTCSDGKDNDDDGAIDCDDPDCAVDCFPI